MGARPRGCPWIKGGWGSPPRQDPPAAGRRRVPGWCQGSAGSASPTRCQHRLSPAATAGSPCKRQAALGGCGAGAPPPALATAGVPVTWVHAAGLTGHTQPCRRRGGCTRVFAGGGCTRVCTSHGEARGIVWCSSGGGGGVCGGPRVQGAERGPRACLGRACAPWGRGCGRAVGVRWGPRLRRGGRGSRQAVGVSWHTLRWGGVGGGGAPWLQATRTHRLCRVGEPGGPQPSAASTHSPGARPGRAAPPKANICPPPVAEVGAGTPGMNPAALGGHPLPCTHPPRVSAHACARTRTHG